MQNSHPGTPKFSDWPFSWYQHMLAHAPVFYDESMDAWHIFRYADVKHVLLDNQNWISQLPFSGPPQPLDSSLIALDPPRHSQLRRLAVSLGISTATNRRLIANHVNALLDPLIAQGHLDVIDGVAKPLPITIISELLGIPPADRAHIARWAEQLSAASWEPADNNPQAEMSAYFTDLFAQRRLLRPDPLDPAHDHHQITRGPRYDLISKLLEAEIDGQPLSHNELLGFCILLLAAGTITVTHLIGNALLCFLAHPATTYIAPHTNPRLLSDASNDPPTILTTLYSNPDLLPDAIAEVLRYRSPVQSMFRIAAHSTTIDGHKIEKGQFIIAHIGAANRDPTIFPDPNTFIISRDNRRAIPFGYGPHHCLGIALAREQAHITLQIMLARLPNMRLQPDAPLQSLNPASFLHGLQRLPITFDP